MEQKYYAPQGLPLFLTLTDHQGKLQRKDLVWNLMRMLLMSKEDLSAQEALEELDRLPRQEFKDLQQQAERWMSDNDLQAYLERKQVNPGAELVPATESEEELMEILDEFPMEVFLSQEMPLTEWD